ncbi:MAG: histone deacetylase [Verrucomicrobiaceae bacterium]|nr:MAG: histone deacetylase [Verrucomicrobiaceae bacterium]
MLTLPRIPLPPHPLPEAWAVRSARPCRTFRRRACASAAACPSPRRDTGRSGTLLPFPPAPPSPDGSGSWLHKGSVERRAVARQRRSGREEGRRSWARLHPKQEVFPQANDSGFFPRPDPCHPCPVNPPRTRKTGIHHDPCYERHDTGAGHPESAHRYRVLQTALSALRPEFVRIPGRKATLQEILLAHDQDYHDLVVRDVRSYADFLSTGDTMISRDSYDVALEATGALLEAADAVVAGKVNSAFCAVRPPGHHATASRGMGFCIFNHVAVAARYLQSRHRLGKIAIIDWDVHHGNGTEAIFLHDPSVLYVSLHQQHIYPHSGPASERGRGAGEGTTLNIPLTGGSDGTAALEEWTRLIDPAVNAFQPDFLLISAGFDARKDDPIGGLRWDDATFSEMTRRSVALADKWCGGRIVSVLEGGYNPAGLASAALAHVTALAG